MNWINSQGQQLQITDDEILVDNKGTLFYNERNEWRNNKKPELQ